MAEPEKRSFKPRGTDRASKLRPMATQSYFESKFVLKLKWLAVSKWLLAFWAAHNGGGAKIKPN